MPRVYFLSDEPTTGRIPSDEVEWQLLLPLGVSLVALLLQYKQYQLDVKAARAASGKPGKQAVAGSPLRRLWPLFAMMILTVLVWVPYFLISPNAPGSKILQWGFANGPCFGLVDGQELRDYSSTHTVALACGIVDPTVDQFTDAEITISRGYTIQRRQVPITVPFSDAMNGKVKRLAEAAAKGTPIPPDSGVTVVMWFQLFLVPSGYDTAQIHSLADVAKAGGLVLDDTRSSTGAVIPIKD